jgi:hypothetical protein
MSSHYVVQMKVLRVDIADPPGPGRTPLGGQPVVEKAKRTVTEIANHTLKGDIFEKTVEKAQAYLALAEDFDGIDDIPKGNTR